MRNIFAKKDKSFNHLAALDDIHYGYRFFLRRLPDEDGFEHFKKHIKAGLSLNSFVRGFLQSAEFRKNCEEENKIIEVKLEDRFIYARMSDESIGRTIINNKQYEKHVTKVLTELLKKGQTFVDIGANIGFFTILAASLVGSYGNVVAIEPYPDNIQMLFASILRNGYKNVCVLPYAASDRNTIFEIAVGGGSNAAISDIEEPTQQKIYTQSIVLDEYLTKYSNIDVVKIDVEGHELNAIKGFMNLLRKFLPVIITEFHPQSLREGGKIEPEEYLSELFGLHKSISIICEDGSLRKCSNSKDIIKSWEEHNARYNLDGSLHLDLIVSSN